MIRLFAGIPCHNRAQAAFRMALAAALRVVLVALTGATLQPPARTVSAAEATAKAAARPNFVIIMADDLGYGDLSAYGGWIETPHLDSLAGSGMRFTDYHSNGNVCSPTRAALLTGRYQQRAGIPGVVFADASRDVHYHGLQDVEITFAELLREAGYQTAIFGKWHLGYDRQYNPVRHGFQEFRGYVSGNVDFFSHVDQEGIYDWWHQDQPAQEEGYTTHLITRHAVRFIAENKERPFCLYLPHEAPHYPYQGPHDQPQRTVSGELATSGSRKDIRNAYREMVQELDQGVGAVVAALKEAGIEGRTLVIFCSDNGANANGSNGPLRGAKGSNWEGGHRVPCIAHWPGTIQEGAVSNQLSASFDILPTLLDAAGVALPQKRPLDGISLLPVLTSKQEPVERRLIWNGAAIRDGQWKLVVNGKGSRGTGLYDLGSDPGEQADLSGQHPERVAALSAALADWRAEMEATATPQPSKP